MRKNSRTQRDFYMIIALVGVMVVIAVGRDIYVYLNQSTIPSDVKQLAEPLDPNLDSGILTELKSRQRFDSSELETVRFDQVFYSLEEQKEQLEEDLADLSPAPPTGTPASSSADATEEGV